MSCSVLLEDKVCEKYNGVKDCNSKEGIKEGEQGRQRETEGRRSKGGSATSFLI